MGYLQLPGAAGDRADTPDRSGLDIVGNITIRAKCAPNDWTAAASQTFMAKSLATGNQRSYQFGVNAAGLFVFQYSTLGVTNIPIASTVAPTVSDGATLWVQVQFEVNTGLTGNTVWFATSTDTTNDPDAVSWTQLGDAVFTAGITSIFSGTALGEIGSINNGAANVFSGKMFVVAVYAGLTGSLDKRAHVDFTDDTTGATTSADAVSGTWTMRSAANIHGSIGDTSALRWNDRAAIGDTSAAVWHDRAAIGDTSNTRWAVRTATFDTSTTSWGIRTSSGEAMSGLWDVRAASGDSNELDWAARAAVGDTADERWSVRTPVGDPAMLGWGMRAVVNDALAMVWADRALSGDQVGFAWDVLEVAGVGDDNTLRWGVRTLAADTLNPRWADRALAADQSTQRWGVRTVVADTVTPLWKVLKAVGTEDVFAWSVQAAAGDAVLLLWKVRHLAGQPSPCLTVELVQIVITGAVQNMAIAATVETC